MKRMYSSMLYSIIVLWKSCKGNLIILLALKIINGFIPVISIMSFQKLVNEVSKFINDSGNFKVAMFYLFLQMLCLLIPVISSQVNHINEKYINKRVTLFSKLQLFDKVEKIPYPMFEKPSFYNRMEFNSDVESRLISNVKSLSNIIQDGISIITVIIYLFTIHYVLIVILLVGIVPLFIIEIKHGNSRYHLFKRMTPMSREAGYIAKLLTNRLSVRDVRIYNLSKFLIDKWKILFELSHDQEIKLLKKQSNGILLSELILIFTYVSASLIVVFLMKRKVLLIGDLVAVVQSIQNIQSSLSSLVRQITILYENCLYVNEYKELLNTEEINLTNRSKSISHIEFINIKNLNFSYDNSENATLRNINIQINKGKKIAIIGSNGSGKTTLIKCLAGLYPIKPNSLFINDLPIESIDLKGYQRRISVLFQDFQKYDFSVKENIGFGDVEKMNDLNKIEDSLREVKLLDFVLNMSNSYDTRLGKLFEGGDELSGGQWQRIAIARSLYKNSDLIILDEATSALDPESEREILDNIFSNYNDRSIVFITHRLSSALYADEILVMKDGEIIERGDHESLMNLEGEYKKLYKAQNRKNREIDYLLA